MVIVFNSGTREKAPLKSTALKQSWRDMQILKYGVQLPMTHSHMPAIIRFCSHQQTCTNESVLRTPYVSPQIMLSYQISKSLHCLQNTRHSSVAIPFISIHNHWENIAEQAKTVSFHFISPPKGTLTAAPYSFPWFISNSCERNAQRKKGDQL